MEDFWKLGAMAWCLTVTGWFLSPVGASLANKLMNKVFAYLVNDASRKVWELEMHIVPDLKQTLSKVEEESKLRSAAKDAESESLEVLDKMERKLSSALHKAEDILDLFDYHKVEEKVRREGKRHGIIWVKLLHDAARCVPGWFRQPLTQAIEITSMVLLVCMSTIAVLLRRSMGAIRSLFRRFRGAIRRRSGEEQISAAEAVSASIQIAIPEAVPVSEPIPIADDIMYSSLECLYWFKYGCMDISNYYRPMLGWLASAVAWALFLWDWLANVIVVARSFRDWSYEEVGINIKQEDDTGLISFLLSVDRKSLRERIEHIKWIVTELKKSDLLEKQSGSSGTAVNDISTKESSSKREIDDLHRTLTRKVFGRDMERDDICRRFRDGPHTRELSSSSSKRYCVIGIHGVTGFGKSTLAQYVCDYEMDEGTGNHYFDHVMFICVSTCFRLHVIFREMLEKMTDQRPLENSSLKSLQEDLKSELRDRRFLLVLDDVWVNMEKHRKELGILNEVLNYGKSGSAVLVTAQREDATRALGAEDPIEISKMDKDQYFSMFMYHALQGSRLTDVGKHIVIGRKIVERLGGSPIAAVTVAAQLSTNTEIEFWETTAKNDLLKETMGALLWSYQQLGAGVRRCFQYCSIFPKGFHLEQDDLVRMWIAQGFVRKRNAEDNIEHLGQGYFNELLQFSFLQVVQGTNDFTMHDLLHKLISKRVPGRADFFRFNVNCSPNDIPREVLHLRVETDNFAGIMNKILELGNLRTLIIEDRSMSIQIVEEYDKAKGSDYAETNKLIKEMFFRNMFMTLRKLRVFIVKVHCDGGLEFSAPASVGQMKHLRYLSFRSKGWARGSLKLSFPCTFSKLYHMQTLDIPECKLSCAEDIADLIELRRFLGCRNFPNVVMPTSLETMPRFEAREEQGHTLKQLEHLNNLRTLQIQGLEFVRSKEEALEANLACKNHLNELELDFNGYGGAYDPDIQAAVLEGLCPSKDLVHLDIQNYTGSSYPIWMLCPTWSGQNSEAPKELYSLELFRCRELDSIPEGSEYFIRLHKLCFSRCRWSRLPDNMEHLTSLQELTINLCGRIKRLPNLPKSLKLITITGYSKLWKSCQIEKHENWQKIKDIPNQEFPVITTDYLFC